MKSRQYQPGFYNLSPKVRDMGSRLRQAEKITSVLTGFSSYPLSSATCLDIGCSAGFITAALAPLFGRTVGLDYDNVALQNAARSDLCLSFVCGDAMALPMANSSIDVIICAQVYEHVPDDETLVAEMYRVLKPGGMVFFSGPNKLFPIEPHYFLPCLHWLPERLANGYLRLLGRGHHYYERSRTLWGLQHLLAPFTIHDVTVQVLQHMQFAGSGRWSRFMSRLPLWVWKILLPILPNYNWILLKSSES